MEKYFKLLKKVELFDKVFDDSDLSAMLSCLQAKIVAYKKNSKIILDKDKDSKIGITLSGNISIVKDDYFGNRIIIAKLEGGDLFGETFVCADIKEIPVTIECTTNCEILLINYRKIITACSSACVFHTRLIENMLKILAKKNIKLNQKIDIISRRSIREKLIAFLEMQMEKAKSKAFIIPFTRFELADYLNTDRSALSREMCKMRDENLITFSGNKIEVLYTTLKN